MRIMNGEPLGDIGGGPGMKGRNNVIQQAEVYPTAYAEYVEPANKYAADEKGYY